MKLGFCPSIGFILDFECVVECDVEFERGNPRLIVNDVLDSTGAVSILRAMDSDKFWREFALRIADEAERDELLIARAAEKASFERAA